MTSLAIVIPTRGRSGSLTAMLRSLNETVPLGAAVSVALVDDGSGDDLSDQLVGLHLPIDVIRVGERRGPAHARNLGARSIEGDVIAFLDDDVVLPVTWFTDVHRAIEERGERPWALLGGDIRSVHSNNLVSQMFEALVIRHDASVDAGSSRPPTC
jgi:glycosyltransferase involved in cell wall biosynthesis